MNTLLTYKNRHQHSCILRVTKLYTQSYKPILSINDLQRFTSLSSSYTRKNPESATLNKFQLHYIILTTLIYNINNICKLLPNNISISIP